VFKGIIKWIIFVIIVGAAVTFILKKNDEKPFVLSKEPELDKQAENPDVEQQVMAFSIDGSSSSGANQWHLMGESARIQEDEIYLYKLKAKAFGEKVVVDITSDEGIYNKTNGEVELFGNVKVVSDDGTTLETERAVWSQVTKEVTTESLVRISREGMTAVGEGAAANSDEKKAILKKNVTVTMEPNTVVNCDGILEIDYNKNTAVFFDNVRVKDKEGVLFADKLTINFDPETEGVVQGVAEGNVKVKKGNSYTMSEKAVYTESTKSAELLGRPRIIIDPEELAELEKQEKGSFQPENL